MRQRRGSGKEETEKRKSEKSGKERNEEQRRKNTGGRKNPSSLAFRKDLEDFLFI